MAQPSDYVTTRLSFFELHLAASVGIGRRCKAMRANLRDKFTGRPLPTPWEKDIVGAQGELSAASYFGLYWAGTVGRIDTPDLPTGLEIKTRLHTPGIKEKIKLDLVLPIGTTLPDEARIVLVYGRGIDFDLVGWTTARHAKEKATIDTKQGNAMALAEHCENYGNSGRVDNIDNKSGKKLAKYSAFGFKAF